MSSSNSHFQVDLDKKQEEEKIPSCIKCKNLHLGGIILGATIGLISLFLYTDIEIVIDWMGVALGFQQFIMIGSIVSLIYISFRLFKSYCTYTFSDGTRDSFVLVCALLSTFALFIAINVSIYYQPIFFDELEIIYAESEAERKKLVLALNCNSFLHGYDWGDYEIWVSNEGGINFFHSIDGTSIDLKHTECYNEK